MANVQGSQPPLPITYGITLAISFEIMTWPLTMAYFRKNNVKLMSYAHCVGPNTFRC